MATAPTKDLDTFPNPYPGRDYEIDIEAPEFTCLCPKTGQPDFATIRIRYVPDARCVELKSLKLYLWSFRDEGAFHEAVTNRILDDLVAAVAPRHMAIEARFSVRGGITTVVRVEHDGRAAAGAAGGGGSSAGASAGIDAGADAGADEGGKSRVTRAGG